MGRNNLAYWTVIGEDLAIRMVPLINIPIPTFLFQSINETLSRHVIHAS